MSFRNEVDSIKEINDNNKIYKENKYNAEYILNQIVIAYIRYLVAIEQVSGKIEIIFAVPLDKRNILEIIVKSPSDNYTGKVVYRKYFPNKNGAMSTVKKIQQIFEIENFKVWHYENKPGYIKYFDKRFSIFIEF